MLKTMLSKVLLCWGIVYASLALSWATTPTPARIAGISLVPIPIDESFVAILWCIGALFAFLGAFRTKATVAYAVIPAVVPIIAALIFLGAWIDTGNVARLASVISYLGFGISIFIVAAHPSAYLNSKWVDTKQKG